LLKTKKKLGIDDTYAIVSKGTLKFHENHDVEIDVATGGSSHFF
jgi:hypothetical protein